MGVFVVDITRTFNEHLTGLHQPFFGRVKQWSLIHVIIIVEVEVVFEHTAEKIEFACDNYKKSTVFCDVEDDTLFVDFLVPGVSAFADKELSYLDIEEFVRDEDSVEEERAAFDVFKREKVFGAGLMGEDFLYGIVVSG